MFNPAKFSGADDVNFSDKTFLVVDDFLGMRGVLRDILRACGANAKSISTASNGDEAIALLERNNFDVVLCDYNLGGGKNGQQILEETKHRNLIGPSCAWMIVTAEKTTDIVTGTAEYQPDTYLLKPVTEAMLRQRLQRIWTKKEAFAEINAAISRKDYLHAVDLCDKRMATDKVNAVDLLRLKTRLLIDCGEHGKARDVFEKTLTEREFPWAKVGLAKILFQEGNHLGAKALLENVVQDNRSYMEAYDWLARCHDALDEHDDAERVLELATRLSPNSVTRQQQLGDISLKLGKLDSAEKAFKRSVSLGEHSVFRTPDAHIGLAKTFGAKGNAGGALEVLDTLTKKFDDDTVRVKALTVEGMIHHQSGNPTLARKVAKELAERMEHMPRLKESAPILDAAELFMLTGEKDKAVDLLQDEVRNNPDNATVLKQIQDVFDNADMSDEGAALVETSRKEAVTRMNEGVLLARNGKLDEAIASLREARRAMPSNSRVLFNLAHVIITRLQQNGPQATLTREARELLLEANRLAPGEPRFAQLMGSLGTLGTLRI